MPKEYCSSCSKPLGSTRNKCHECGGESIRADNARTFKLNNGLLDVFKLSSYR